jgi:hypothetical protein
VFSSAVGDETFAQHDNTEKKTKQIHSGLITSSNAEATASPAEK